MKYLHTFFLLFVAVNFIYPQTDTLKYDLSEIIISATKTETNSIELASTVDIISNRAIENSAKSSVVDLLRNVPGLSIVQQGGQGRMSSLFMRGANSNHTLVLIDGIEVNDPSSSNNAFDFASLQTTDVEKIEVVRGPQSTLYGSDAMGGVVNIITRKGNGTPKFLFGAEGGSNSFYKGFGSFTGSLKMFDYALNLAHLRTDGISSISEKYGNSEEDGFTNTTLSARVGANLFENLNLSLYYRYSKSDSDLDQSDSNGDDPNFTSNVEENIFRAEAKLNLFDSGWQQKFGISHLRRISHQIDEVDEIRPTTSSSSFLNGTKTKLDWQNNIYLLEHNLITFGVETETEKANTEYISYSQWGPWESTFPEQAATTTGIYLQDQININNSFFATAGIRYDNHEKFGGKTTFRIAPAYFISATGTKIKFTYGTGFKSPSLYNLFDPAYGNSDLRPEESDGFDAGIEQYLWNNKIILGVTYFSTNYENLIGFDANYVSININKAEAKGFEVTASLIDFNSFSAYASYTYTDAKDKSENGDKALLRRPENKVTFSLDYNWQNKLNANAQLRYIGEREDEDFSVWPSNRVTLDAYTVVDLAVSYKLFDYLKLNARIENLLDTDYEEVLFYGTLGRSFYGGVSITL